MTEPVSATDRVPVVGYFTMEYPRATDTFIQREVASLRRLGVDVRSYSARRPGDEHMVGEEQRTERAGTGYLLPASPAAVAAAQAAALRRSPGAWRRAATLARDTARAGTKGHLYQGFYFAEAALLAERLVADGVGHLHAHFGDVATSVAMIAAELAGIPYSFTLHGPGVFFDANVWRLDAKIEHAAFVSCISWFCRSQAELLSTPEAAAKLKIVHCGVDPDRYARPEAGDAGSIRLTFVARLANVKGLGVLLDALALLDRRDVTLAVVGDGPDRERWEQQTARLGLGDQVTFLGFRSQSEVAEQLGVTDVFVLPSFAEGVPVTLMEPGAAGIPVIATNVGGVTELVIDGETGLVVPPGDAAALADAVARLADDPALRRRLGDAAARKVRADFDSLTEAGRLAGLFAGRLDGPVRPPVWS